MRHAYPARRTLPGTGYPSTVGNLSGFSPMRDEPQPVETPEPTYRVKSTESIEALFRLDNEAREVGDFTDAFLDNDY